MFDFFGDLPKSDAAAELDLTLCEAALDLLPNNTDMDKVWAVLTTLRDRLYQRTLDNFAAREAAT